MKYYYQLLILITFFLYRSKTQKIGNEKAEKYNFVSVNKNDPNGYILNKEKNEAQSNHKKRQLENWQPIEIFVDLTSIQMEIDRKEYSYLEFTDFESAVEKVKNTLRTLVSVNIPPTGRVNLKTTTDLLSSNGFSNGYYNESLISGVPADLIILVRYWNSNKDDLMSEKYFAKPKIIQPNNANERPQVGIVILYPLFDLTENNIEEYLKYLFLHEFTHILGFLPEYINKFTQEVTINRISGQPITKKAINSSNVIEHAKKYFGCSSLSYLELEEQTTFENLNHSHWDSRILLGEYMTSEPYFADQVISEFTLYLLEDLSFYKTNKYTGGLMKFGKNRKCNFLEKDCATSAGDPLNNYDFCKEGDQPTCSSGRQSRTYCVRNSDSYYPVGNYKRNLGYRNWGKINADYCPVSDTYREDNQYHYVGDCNLGSGKYGSSIYYGNDEVTDQDYNILNFDGSIGQIYGENSFCALSSLISINDEHNRDSIIKERIRPTCYQMFCSDQSLTIQMKDQYFVCPQEGGILNITNYEGYIYCPEYNLICTGTKLCNNMFDCVDKNSTAKEDLKYDSIHEDSDGSVIEGVEKNSDFSSDLLIIKGYEQSDDENSKCPQNCFQCTDERRCFECSPEYQYYKGTTEATRTPIKCEKKKPSDDYHYNVTNYYIFDTIKRIVYFDCIEGCKKCQNGSICDMCSPDHKLNSDHTKCEDRIPHCDTYDPDSLIEDSEDNNHGPAYTKCKKCEEPNYVCLKINGVDDLEHCYEYNTTEYPHIFCTRDRFPAPSDDKCEIITNTSLTDEFKSISKKTIETLVDDYVDLYYPHRKKIEHFVNEEHDYTITIFFDTNCTEELRKLGYYSIDDKEITNMMREQNSNLFVEDDDPIATVFVNYGGKNYYLTVYTIDGYEISLNDTTSNWEEIKVNIGNNFSSIINQTLGSIVLDAVKYGEFDVFNESAGEFTTLCRNVTLLGVDVPFFRRKNYFYVHKFSNAYSCRADVCLATNKVFLETTAYCVCEQSYEIDYDYTNEEFFFYNVTENSKINKAKEAFEVFGCTEDTFNSRHIKKNFGFYFSLISIVFQIILFIIYAIAGKPINFSKGAVVSTSNPPKRVPMKINADWIKNGLLNEHDEEKDIQSKDEIDDEFVMEEFNYNIDKHDTSSYSVDTDLMKKQIGDNKDTEKDGLAEKPDEKKKKKILILLPDKTKKDEESNFDDDLMPSKDKKQEKKNFFQVYWIILSLKQHIINYFSSFKNLKITESYVPKYIMGIRSLFMIVFVFFVNAMFLSQKYYDKKFQHFNQKYSLVPGYGDIKISEGEKFSYGFGHTAAYGFYTFLIYLVVQLLFGIFVFSVRKELTELFNSKDVLKINSLAKTLKAKYILYFVIVIILMIALFMYLTNFNGVYAGSGNDFGPAGLWSLIFIEIFPFVWSLVLAIFRYFGIVCQSKVLYGISQVFMF